MQRHTVRLLWTSDQPVAETSTYTGQHNRHTSMPGAGLESATLATKWQQTYVIDSEATGISNGHNNTHIHKYYPIRPKIP
jgi:hypothetical protein